MLENIKKTLKRTKLFKFYVEYKVRSNEKKRFLSAFSFPMNRLDTMSDKELQLDFKNEVLHHRFDFNEYYNLYQLWKLDKVQREEFISTAEINTIYREVVSSDIRTLLWDKSKFLKEYTTFVNRKWCFPCDSSTGKSTFQKLLEDCDCILKETENTCGNGISTRLFHLKLHGYIRGSYIL